MTIRRLLLLCLLTVTLGVTGPFARGLSAQAAQLLQPANLTWSAAAIPLTPGATSSKRCQRGAVAWSACTLDLDMPERGDPVAIVTGKIIDHVLDGTSGDLARSRLFRPPRMG
ncbi:MAG: hypothetical protein Q8S27_08525 [Hoeflea sp.]|uniref:hypothetical protein n=1 Tax=Hoeflea sp. TaxID=1940281 RepID=UPI002731E80E|nr:hypothetical protein [Hoeflea sp.]MDP3524609.1 hypothetical protein [Hoeflea sp.]MDZ7600643.1 hypothetical protein [Hoeflea sp.]